MEERFRNPSPTQPPNTTDALIIGGGVVGVVTALRLLQAGKKVVLVEARDALGLEASAARAGLLTTVAEGEAGTPYSRLSIAGLKRFRQLVAEVGGEQHHARHGVVESPHLRVAQDSKELELLSAYLADPGLADPHERQLDAAALRARHPYIAEGIAGGIVGAHAHHTYPPALVSALAQCALDLGLTLLTQTRVEALVHTTSRVIGGRLSTGVEIEAAETIVATGYQTGSLLEGMGLQVPISPVRGQMIVVGLPTRHRFEPVITTGRGYIVPKAGGRVVIGATHEARKGTPNHTLGGLSSLAEIARVVPILLQAPVLDQFVGIRPMTPDGYPLIGRFAGLDGLIMATGHGSHGVLLSAITADVVCGLALGEPAHKDFEAFRPDRFSVAA